MLPIGMLLTWAGYSISLWGWCLLRGYNVTLGQLMSPTHPYGSGKGQAWPPPLLGPDVIFPGGRSAAAPAQNTPATPGTFKPITPGAIPVPASGTCPAGYTPIAGQCVPFAE